MKKISTAAAKASRKIAEQKLTIGLDLGDRSSWYCVLKMMCLALDRPGLRRLLLEV